MYCIFTLTVNTKKLSGFTTEKDISVTYNGERGSLDWEEYGLTLLFEESDLSGENKCPVHVTAGESGAFRFPDKVERASTVYHIDCPKQLHASVTLRIQHSLAKEDIPHLCFVTCSEDQPPYDCSIVHGGHFTPNYGEIIINKFSLYSIGRYTRLRVRNVLSILERSYAASFYRSVQPTPLRSGYSWNIYMSAVKNCSIFRNSVQQYIKDEYKDEVKWEAGGVVHFDSDHIDIKALTSYESGNQDDFSLEESGLDSLRENDISSYVDGCPPHIKFVLKMKGGCPFKMKGGCPFKIRFTLQGFREPNTFTYSHLPTGKT